MDYENKHTNEFKKAFSTMSKIRKEIASSVEIESTRFEKFIDDLRMGDEISWVELDGREYSGTVIQYIAGSSPGVVILNDYGRVVLTLTKNAVMISKAWRVK